MECTTGSLRRSTCLTCQHSDQHRIWSTTRSHGTHTTDAPARGRLRPAAGYTELARQFTESAVSAAHSVGIICHTLRNVATASFAAVGVPVVDLYHRQLGIFDFCSRFVVDVNN